MLDILSFYLILRPFLIYSETSIDGQFLISMRDFVIIINIENITITVKIERIEEITSLGLD